MSPHVQKTPGTRELLLVQSSMSHIVGPRCLLVSSSQGFISSNPSVENVGGIFRQIKNEQQMSLEVIHLKSQETNCSKKNLLSSQKWKILRASKVCNEGDKCSWLYSLRTEGAWPSALCFLSKQCYEQEVGFYISSASIAMDAERENICWGQTSRFYTCCPFGSYIIHVFPFSHKQNTPISSPKC